MRREKYFRNEKTWEKCENKFTTMVFLAQASES
jgi:hypothetical protein